MWRTTTVTPPAIPKLLGDDDVLALAPSDVVEAMRRALQAHAADALSSPPRTSVETEQGRWVFTVGAMEGGCQGFRAYGVGTAADDEQLVAVWADGRCQGVVIGQQLGLRRTAEIGAVAVDVLARPDAATLGLIGAGPQGLAHVREVAAVRQLEQVQVFSRTPARRESAARWLVTACGLAAEPVATAEDAADGVDVLTLATSSQQVVVDPAAIAQGTHVTTLGPKYVGRHELPVEVAQRAAVIVTDSLAQLDTYSSPFFLKGLPEPPRIRELSSVVAHGVDRDPNDVTVFCSVGLAGTEPVLAQALLGPAH